MKPDAQPHPLPISVAIVEDDAGVRRSLVGLIKNASGCTCVGDFANGESAVSELPLCPAGVVLVDINLPGMNGVDCVRQLASLMPAAQFIMLTVHQDADTIFESLKAGASGYLLKPVRKDELLQAVRDVVAGGSPMTSSVARKIVQFFQRRTPEPLDELQALSDRERAVLDLLAQGYVYKEIGDQLGISLWTVYTYVHRTYQKLHVTGRIEALAKYRGDSSRR